MYIFCTYTTVYIYIQYTCTSGLTRYCVYPRRCIYYVETYIIYHNISSAVSLWGYHWCLAEIRHWHPPVNGDHHPRTRWDPPKRYHKMIGSICHQIDGGPFERRNSIWPWVLNFRTPAEHFDVLPQQNCRNRRQSLECGCWRQHSPPKNESSHHWFCLQCTCILRFNSKLLVRLLGL